MPSFLPQAQFQMKGEYNPSLRKKKQNKKKAKGNKQERYSIDIVSSYSPVSKTFRLEGEKG